MSRGLGDVYKRQQLDNDFLEDHNYSREEIVSGVKDVLNRYHLDSMSALF